MLKAISQSSGHASSTVMSIMEEAALEMGRCFRVCEFEFFCGTWGRFRSRLEFGSLWDIFEI